MNPDLQDLQTVSDPADLPRVEIDQATADVAYVLVFTETTDGVKLQAMRGVNTSVRLLAIGNVAARGIGTVLPSIMAAVGPAPQKVAELKPKKKTPAKATKKKAAKKAPAKARKAKRK